jgi:hypothetical protein
MGGRHEPVQLLRLLQRVATLALGTRPECERKKNMGRLADWPLHLAHSEKVVQMRLDAGQAYTPTQSHISLSVLVHEDNEEKGSGNTGTAPRG